jgi:hypothetical protein
VVIHEAFQRPVFGPAEVIIHHRQRESRQRWRRPPATDLPGKRSAVFADRHDAVHGHVAKAAWRPE